MKILVKRERLDPVMTSDRQAPATAGLEVQESELFAEAELLTSRDLLEQVALQSGLVAADQASGSATGTDPSPARLDRIVAALRARLDVTPIRKTTMIAVSYSAADPQLAARVLERLAALYLAKHLAVHRPAGAHQFFSEQTARAEETLREAQARVRAFNEREQVLAAQGEKENTLLKLSEFDATLQQTAAAIADATRRLSAIDAELRQTPPRQVTQIRDGGNVEAVRSLRNQILQLEIKRNDLLQRFTAQYPPVMQLEAEIGQLRRALTAAEQAPLTDEVTDQNPTHQWLRSESARVRTEREALMARADAIRRTLAEYRERARRLDAQAIEQQALLHDVTVAQENVGLYQRKQEETRISDALDRTRIANVAVAEPPAVPHSARSARPLILMFGAVATVVLSLGVAFLLHALNPRFRTADEVYSVLEVPVLASLPAAE